MPRSAPPGYRELNVGEIIPKETFWWFQDLVKFLDAQDTAPKN